MSADHYAKAFFYFFVRNPILKVLLYMAAAFVFALPLLLWVGSAKSISGWLVSISGLPNEYEELFTGVFFVAIAITVGLVLTRVSNRYEKWKAERQGLDM
jgi:hypothetical protein